jgi:hypothetical protein
MQNTVLALSCHGWRTEATSHQTQKRMRSREYSGGYHVSNLSVSQAPVSCSSG